MPDFYAVEVKTVDRHRVCFSQISNLFTGFFTEFAGISQQESHRKESQRWRGEEKDGMQGGG